LFVVVFLEKKKGSVTFGASVVDQAIPFFSRLKNQVFEILCGLLSRRPPVQEPGDLFRPDGKHIEDHIIITKRKGGIPCIEDPEQAFRQREDPEHLLTTFL